MVMHSSRVPAAVTLDAWLLILGVAVTVLIVESSFIPRAAMVLASQAELVSFAAGTLFTSILTTTPAIALFAELSPYIPAWKLALIGGMGAVVGDLLVFRFVRSPFVEYFVRAFTTSRLLRFGKALERGPLWWVPPLLGALVIASPLPDEIGLLMMGLSRIRMPAFIALSYTMNAAGIFAIASIGNSLLT